jgi:amino acid permease
MEKVVYDVAFTWFEWCGIGIMFFGSLIVITRALDDFKFKVKRGNPTAKFVVCTLILVAVCSGVPAFQMHNNKQVVRALVEGKTIVDKHTGKPVDNGRIRRLKHVHRRALSAFEGF